MLDKTLILLIIKFIVNYDRNKPARIKEKLCNLIYSLELTSKNYVNFMPN